MLTEPPMNPTRNREKMIEVMFEKYGFDATYIAIQVQQKILPFFIYFILNLDNLSIGATTKAMKTPRAKIPKGNTAFSKPRVVA